MKTASRYLINEMPLLVYPTTAQAIGFKEAIVLQQVHSWLNNVRSRPQEEIGIFQDGRWWAGMASYAWQGYFLWWSAKTIKKTLRHLEDKGLLISEKDQLYSLTKIKWYTVDYEALNRYLEIWNFDQNSEQNDDKNQEHGSDEINMISPMGSKRSDQSDQIETILTGLSGNLFGTSSDIFDNVEDAEGVDEDEWEDFDPSDDPFDI